MGNTPSFTSTEPLAQGKHRNLSTISLPPTIPRRHNIKDAERKEIFPISDEGAPLYPGRRGSIGFFRGKRARAPVALDHNQLFRNLQDLQNIDTNCCPRQSYHYLSDSNTNSLSTTPTTAATTPALTAAATPTTPVGPQYHYNHNNNQYNHPLHPLQSRSPQPTSPVAVSIQDYHPRQEQKLATFMKRNLLPPHALLAPPSNLVIPSSNFQSNTSSTTCSPVLEDNCSNATTPMAAPEQNQLSHQFNINSYNHTQQQQLNIHPHPILQHSNTYPFDTLHRPPFENHSSIDYIPSTHDVPCLKVSEWGNQGRWTGEQEWSDDIPEGLEHDGDFSKRVQRSASRSSSPSSPSSPSPSERSEEFESNHDINNFKDTEISTRSCQCQPSQQQQQQHEQQGQQEQAQHPFSAHGYFEQGHEHVLDLEHDGSCISPHQKQHSPDFDIDPSAAPLSSSFSSLATLNPHTKTPSKEDERSLVILSVGCGNSQWATEMALAHPQSAVHAINVSQIPSLPMVPESTPSFDLDNLFFYNLDDNSLKVPFVSNSVDYIHVRRFLPNVNKTKYLAFLRELVRVLKVDGYLELVELDPRLRDSGVDSCWPSYWTLIGFDKLGIDTSLALNLGGILSTMPGIQVLHKSSVNMPIGIHGGRVGLAAELLCWRFALIVRPWLMRQAMLSGSEFDELLNRAREETRTLRSFQVCHVAVGRKTATGGFSF
ncbi:hypothetical protein BGZ76_008742 [Entomortierella beljakovae]|nr:hypothetical protein BGZ76_008742 [Entomortierella beljakovae]